jgi:hypothetical protein
MRRPLLAALVLTVASSVGCGSGSSAGGNSINAAEFGRSCLAASECVPVYSGTLGCCGSGCPNAAINASSYSLYEADVTASLPACDNGSLPCPELDATGCGVDVACTYGVCEITSR